MEVHFFLTREDLWHYYIYAYRKHLLWPLLLLLLFYMVLTLIALQLLYPFSPANVLLWFMFLFMLLILPVLTGVLTTRRSVSHGERWGGEHSISLTREGLQQRSELGEGVQRWRAIKTIAQDKHNLYFILAVAGTSKIVMGVIVPKRAFVSPENAETFLDQARRYWTSERQGSLR